MSDNMKCCGDCSDCYINFYKMRCPEIEHYITQTQEKKRKELEPFDELRQSVKTVKVFKPSKETEENIKKWVKKE